MSHPVYMDHHATTPVAPEVFEAMRPYFTERFGNPSSRGHAFGWEAQEAVQLARQQVAALIGATPAEILFTSGATESNNLALKGVLDAAAPRVPHVITVATEHRSVLEPLERRQRTGMRVTVLPVQSDGRVDVEQLAAAMTESTVLVSVMAANNEIGVLQPLDEIARLTRSRGALFHTDFTQAAFLMPIDVRRLPVDLLTISGHKMYGPKGVGALYVHRDHLRESLIGQAEGGGQEQGLRAGTLNVPGIVGLGEACALARARREQDGLYLGQLRNRLLDGLTAGITELRINGSREHRLPNNLNVSVPGVDGDLLLSRLPDLAISSGSACHGAIGRPSHVLTALGVDPPLALASLRFGLGRSNTREQVDQAISQVVHAVHRLRVSDTGGISGIPVSLGA